MRQAILILAFVLTTFLCFGQKQHLEIAKDFNRYEGDLKEYYDNVFAVLYKGYSNKPIARYTSMPAFSNEYSFSIEKIDGKNYVVSNSLSESYWYAKNRKRVKLVSNKKELIKDLYSKIVDLFLILEEQTKRSEDDLMGFDGITYYFATTDINGQVKIGETWSPIDNTLLGRLVKTCDNIYALGNGKNISQMETLMEIEELLNDIKQ
ncbi:hypothetical protein SAMN05444285_10787 [Draconibacterium orientale]|uniref:Uncharacterized protein n=1 Tax=Draconibacterium orientale TaxID=1168034 RepID=X5DG03_9BACT|nr:hypothetical protein [Draconibacterium orientale]AHW61868.1 hypothetical protein FH5T_09945 [Draconibacterium orientale]SET17784.1 hypothetical protein SAMN05444285_10787 [Draconibacterium orientale]